MAYLEVKNLAKQFDNEKVIKGISFSLEKGQTLVVAGPSGAGKSTLLRCLNGLEEIDQGEVFLNGKKLKDSSDFGFVFQQFQLFPQYTALENVSLAPSLHNLGSKQEIEQRSLDLLESFSLKEHVHKYPYQLSGGQRQRVAIARAMILDPEILCLDEPTSALDPALRDQVAELILELNEKGMTQIVVTHDLVFAEKIADKLIYLADGFIDPDYVSGLENSGEADE
ncbi:MAG: amino acid ABC transporter ATP-binding protein [Clostridiaceae bacterium]|nr:amino acid ABC transporter ATP-binding protein [Clostridiaceae bacterium]